MLVCLVRYAGSTCLKIYEGLYIPLETGKIQILKEILIKKIVLICFPLFSFFL